MPTVTAPTAVPLFSMIDGLRPVRNLIGVSDPDVHRIDGRWTMFLGGFTTGLRVGLFSAALPPGAPLSSLQWALTTQPGAPGRALPIVDNPPRGAWDRPGMHTPCYVEGETADGEPERRIYYAGRCSRAVTGPSSRYAIGVLRQIGGRWVRHGPPVLTGTAERPSALEPTVRFDRGVWRMWYQSTVGEPGPGEQPDYRICCTESADGLSGWSPPRPFSGTDDGFFDCAVRPVSDRFEMVVARGTNLHGTSDYPEQGLWWLDSATGSGSRAEWTATPLRLLDADRTPLPWLGNGTLGPSFHYGDTEADRTTLYVFCTGTHVRRRWLEHAARQLAAGRRPPVPAPFHFTTGRLAFPDVPRVPARPAGPEPAARS